MLECVKSANSVRRVAHSSNGTSCSLANLYHILIWCSGANLLLDVTKENLRLADFGLAARFSEQKKFYQVVGTPPFMAPEVVRCGEGKAAYTAKCDVWSTGCTIIEMAQGHFPWLKSSKYCSLAVLYKVSSCMCKGRGWSFISRGQVLFFFALPHI